MEPDNNVSERAKRIGIGFCIAVAVFIPVAYLFSLAGQN